MNSRLIEIDGAKLRKLLESKGVELAVASREMGYDSSFLSRSCTRNSVSPNGAKSIEHIYGVSLDDYKKTEPEPFPEVLPLEKIEEREEQQGNE